MWPQGQEPVRGVKFGEAIDAVDEKDQGVELLLGERGFNLEFGGNLCGTKGCEIRRHVLKWSMNARLACWRGVSRMSHARLTRFLLLYTWRRVVAKSRDCQTTIGTLVPYRSGRSGRSPTPLRR